MKIKINFILEMSSMNPNDSTRSSSGKEDGLMELSKNKSHKNFKEKSIFVFL
jgi:hypothetical protein